MTGEVIFTKAITEPSYETKQIDSLRDQIVEYVRFFQDKADVLKDVVVVRVKVGLEEMKK